MCALHPAIKLAELGLAISEIVKEVLMPYKFPTKVKENDLSPGNGSIPNWSTAFDYLQRGIAIFDPVDKKIKEINKTFAAMLGHEAGDVSEMTLEVLFRHYLQPERLREIIAKCQEVEQLTVTMNNDIDQPFTHSLKMDMSLIGGGDIYNHCIIIMLTDDLNRLMDERERESLGSQLQQAQKMEAIGALAGGIAHDFNNILGVMTGYTELASLNINQGDQTNDYLNEVMVAAERARLLIQQLLSFSRKDSTHNIVIDLKKEITRAVNMLSHIVPKMIQINMELDEDLYSIKGDPSQIIQIFLNLGANARDALIDGGSISISGRNTYLDAEVGSVKKGLAPGKYVKIIFKDDGLGMEPEVLSRIFEPFFTTKESGKGTGMGLASVYGTVKEHLGMISCQSTPTQGCSFEILLPAMEDRSAQLMGSTPDSSASSDNFNELVLVVDDERALREISKEILQKAGFRVLEASSGEDALDRLNSTQENIDLIILDLNMPGMGGIKCLSEISKLFPEMKVLLSSGYLPDTDYQDLVDLGDTDFLPKPFRTKELLAAVKRSLAPQ